MNRQEAYNKMLNGETIKHEYFTDDEYIYYDKKSNSIKTEDGYDFTSQFWEIKIFRNGWSIINK